MTATKKPIVLLILDGFGHSDNTEHNAVYSAHPPVWDRIWANNPKGLIKTSGLAVGLPEGQMGNSEVGHVTIGAGRVVSQSFTRINKAIEDGDFFENPAYIAAIDKAVNNGRAVHIMGLLSEGEIGRASCRERVESLGGAVTLRRKDVEAWQMERRSMSRVRR